MKLAFAKSLVQDAPILILDEPTATLDVPTSRELREVVRELNRRGRTILYTTHQMAEAEELCQRVAVIDRGQVIAEGSIEALKSMVSRQGTIRVEGVIPPEAFEAAKSLPGVLEAALTAQESRTRLTILTSDPRALLPGLLRALYDRGATIEYVSPGDVTLEDVFLADWARALRGYVAAMSPVVTALAVVQRHKSQLCIATDVIWQTALSRLRIYMRRPGGFPLDVLFPSVVAFLPLLLGQAVAGAQASDNFSARVGTPAYVPFMLIGANVFVLVMRAIWEVGFWLRSEQNTGTLEVWYLAPASPLWVLAGVAVSFRVERAGRFSALLWPGLPPLAGEPPAGRSFAGARLSTRWVDPYLCAQPARRRAGAAAQRGR